MNRHFHIRWSDSKLDWEAFLTVDAANVAAEQLVQPGESYVVEELGADCQRCRTLAVGFPARLSR